MGYQINEYDCCVLQKHFNDKQCTKLCHIDYLKILRVDYNIFSSVISDIDAEYGKFSKMIITRGKIQKYLIMTIDYSFSGKLIFSMVNYIGNIIDDIP